MYVLVVEPEYVWGLASGTIFHYSKEAQAVFVHYLAEGFVRCLTFLAFDGLSRDVYKIGMRLH